MSFKFHSSHLLAAMTVGSGLAWPAGMAINKLNAFHLHAGRHESRAHFRDPRRVELSAGRTLAHRNVAAAFKFSFKLNYI